MAIETIPALFLHAVRTHKRKDAFRYKKAGKYVDISHDQTLDLVDKASLGITALGLAKGDRIALLSENRFEWVVADLAILSAGCINVPVYPTLPSGHIEYILKDSEARTIFVSNAEQLEKIQAIRSNLPNLQHVIVLEAAGTSDDTISLDDLIAKGAAQSGSPDYESRISTIGKYDWASILYTSGTTGSPKGVILNQWNFVSNVTAVLKVLSVGNTDSCLSFLPLSHVFERTGGYYAMMLGGASIAYAESIETVAQNLQEVHPTILVSVPRLYEKMYGRILDAVTAGSGLKKQLFFWAIGVGRIYVRQKLENRISPPVKMQYKLAMGLVLKKLKGRTGGRLRFFVSGGAPLAREIAEFFYAAGLPILEGYGLTETSPVITLNTFDHFKFGTVGRPLPGVEVRIAEDGEICARGPNIMLGYYKKPDLTSEVMKDGWFHTGDIGYLDEKGFLTITDRKKDIIVTAGGKN
ncbi:MAG: long-chain fatty acid--CoA ligase, partial [bacterium]|nr:long-chain fatty acid--CoA ligase [bacterium]